MDFETFKVIYTFKLNFTTTHKETINSVSRLKKLSGDRVIQRKVLYLVVTNRLTNQNEN